MKIAIFSPYATVVPHFETELDIAQQHLDEGDEVEFFNCTGKLANCDFNLDLSPDRCRDCIGRRNMGIELLTEQVSCHEFASAVRREFPKFDSLESLKAFRIKNFDIGWAVLSSLVSMCRDPEPDLDLHAALLNRFLNAALSTYEQTLRYLETNQVDRVYVFNGRFASMRAVFRACQEMKVDCWMHERGCDGQHYEIFKNHLPHDLVKIEAAIRTQWDVAGAESSRVAVAKQWFQDRVDRVEKVWHSFVKDQQVGRLPAEFNDQEKNIAIFCSSDDEFVAIGDSWNNSLYPNQVTAIRQIAHDLLNSQPNTKLYLRVHPNLRNVDNARKREMLELNSPNLIVIPPDADIDTYALMKTCNSVVSFGSSVGIEAVYWDKPSVLLGPCFYQNLGGIYRPDSHAKTIRLLSSDLEKKDKLGALMYGFWLQTRGLPHKYFESSDLFEGRFKGQTLFAKKPRASRSTRISQKLNRLAKRLVRISG